MTTALTADTLRQMLTDLIEACYKYDATELTRSEWFAIFQSMETKLYDNPPPAPIQPLPPPNPLPEL